jgi:hypothetical protein
MNKLFRSVVALSYALALSASAVAQNTGPLPSWNAGATTGKRPGFALIVHHTDAVGEYAYDKDTKVGHLEKALVAAKANGWAIANMKNDWKVIFP